VRACMHIETTSISHSDGWRSVSCSHTSYETYFVILQTGKERDIVYVCANTCACIFVFDTANSFVFCYFIILPFFNTECASYDDEAGTAATV